MVASSNSNNQDVSKCCYCLLKFKNKYEGPVYIYLINLMWPYWFWQLYYLLINKMRWYDRLTIKTARKGQINVFVKKIAFCLFLSNSTSQLYFNYVQYYSGLWFSRCHRKFPLKTDGNAVLHRNTAFFLWNFLWRGKYHRLKLEIKVQQEGV